MLVHRSRRHSPDAGLIFPFHKTVFTVLIRSANLIELAQKLDIFDRKKQASSVLSGYESKEKKIGQRKLARLKFLVLRDQWQPAISIESCRDSEAIIVPDELVPK